MNKKFSDKNQTIIELLCRTTAPIWSKILNGIISVEVEYDNSSDTIGIPYEITSKPILSDIPTIYFGIVKKDNEIRKKIILRSNVPRENMELNIIDAPSEISTDIPKKLGIGAGEIPIIFTFQSSEISTQKGIIKLKTVYNKDISEQIMEINYTVIVRK